MIPCISVLRFGWIYSRTTRTALAAQLNNALNKIRFPTLIRPFGIGVKAGEFVPIHPADSRPGRLRADQISLSLGMFLFSS
ncbi:MAG: hypothetical protein WD969_15835 [Paracoccaceae bacterium]